MSAEREGAEGQAAPDPMRAVRDHADIEPTEPEILPFMQGGRDRAILAGCGAEMERAGRAGLAAFGAEDERIAGSAAAVVLRRWRVSPDEREDILQEARLGVWEARRRFDPARGAAFKTYAWHYAQGRAAQYARDDLHLSGPRGGNSHRTRMRLRLGLQDPGKLLVRDVVMVPVLHHPWVQEPSWRPNYGDVEVREFLGRLLAAWKAKYPRRSFRDIQRLVAWRMAGYSQSETGEQIGCSQREVARRLATLRTLGMRPDGAC